MAKMIYFIERNQQGYWVIHGLAGTRTYIYYTKTEAIRLYRKYCKTQKG